jgi:hypothetical protein
MFSNTRGASTVQPVRNDTARTSKRSVLGIRRRDVVARIYAVKACPTCGLPIRDPIPARLGFCDRCREFTGMCGAGRRVICPDILTKTTWHTPCTELGTIAWAITQDKSPVTIVLCWTHDADVRLGATPWIARAEPLAVVRGKRRRPRSTAGQSR